MNFKGIMCGLAITLVLTPALAQLSDKPMRFTFHDPCGGGNANSCADVMVGQGVFNSNTVKTFQAARLEHINAGNGISRVFISSPGGSLSAGIALGREIRRLQLDTETGSSLDEGIRVKDGWEIKPLLRNAKCLSACAYAFLGGVKRTVMSDNALGVHQFSSEGGATQHPKPARGPDVPEETSLRYKGTAAPR